MVGGESRKSRRPFAVTESRASANSCRPSQTYGSSATSKNTSSKCLTLFIQRNAEKNVTGKGKWQLVRAITSSENTGDVIVENSSGAQSQSATQMSSCRDRRTLSGDRSRPSLNRQLQPEDRPAGNYSLIVSSLMPPNRRVSRVSAHALIRVDAQPALMRRSMRRNRTPPNEAITWVQTSVEGDP